MSPRLDPNDPRPIKVQIAAALREEYVPGGRLSTVAELASDWAVAKETVRAALKELQAEGVVVTWQGRGTFYVTEKPSDEDITPEMITKQLELLMGQVADLTDRIAHLESRDRKSDQ